MRLKIIMIVGLIAVIIILALFGSGIKEKALKGVTQDIPEYNCEDGLCTSCIISGNLCSCGEHTCDCGNISVDKAECELYS